MTNHNFELEGVGNGFCYTHQSFDCAESGTAWEDAKAEAAGKYNPDLEPYCPGCDTLAEDMPYLDKFRSKKESRADYIRREEGTFNTVNGHFLCDTCYIKAGCPSSPYGWKCP